MYAGHFAVGLALKAKRPAAPTWAILLGTGFLDVLFGIFVMLGIERVTMTPHVGQGFSLDFIDWSHSLVMSLVWSALYGLIFWRRGRTVAFLVGFAVFSHFLLDLPMHPKDLALWPYSATHIGFGLWNRLPHGWWWIELAVIAAACTYYLLRNTRKTGAISSAPPEESMSSFFVWRRASAPFALGSARRQTSFGRHAWWASAVVVLLHVLNAPWWKS